MALAIHSSCPAYKTESGAGNTTATLTTASFTPPLGSLLVVLYANAFAAELTNQPSNTGGAVTWAAAAKITESANSCAASIWTGSVTTSASMTVTVTLNGAASETWGFGVAVVTGAATTQNGAVQPQTNTAALPSATIASLVGSNSLVLGSIANFTNATVGTPGANQTLTFGSQTYSLSDGGTTSAIWAQYDTRISLAAGASDTINDTAPSVQFSMVAAEILAAPATASVVNPPLHIPTNWSAVRRAMYR